MTIVFADGWQDIAVAAVTLSLLLVGAVYAVGAMFDSDRLKGFAKTEFMQVIASGILVAGLLVFATTLETTAFSIAGQDHIAFAQSYLTDLNTNLQKLYIVGLGFDAVLETLAKLQLDLSGVIAGLAAYPFAGFGIVANNLEMALTGIFGAIILNALQINLLTFVQSTMMYYFLPAGVILRSFNPTRSVGAFLIALAIGLYFVFPLTYVLAAQSVAKMNTDIAGATDSMNSFQSSVNLNEEGLLDVAAVKNFITGLERSVWTVPGNINANLTQVIMADIFMQVVILPAIGLTITYVFIRQLTRALGSYVDVGSWRLPG